MKTDGRFIGFLVAGGLNTVVGYVLYGGLILIGMVPYLAIVVSAIFGILFNFVSIGTVFQSRNLHALPRFLAVYAVMLPFNMVLLEILIQVGLGPFIGQAVAIMICAPIYFTMMRQFVFKASEQFR